ncbi:2'-5' RNA ligase family protein [Candidatus Nitrosotenuis uzonensis]|uniref:Uncharacterized protein n=1 Tax=Candidatus Nitrosotenuis uzonensis TaxID=1407055 RepID=V6ASK9_9ARCH|nr:2'-5' RNA ligase family protein [Candidatus Nitrosotenuis uzonensis]CDI05525.1 conserved hypothetical protein [Candidatus Nitrosotenuis uzonensis]
MTYSIWLEPSAKDKKYLQNIIYDLAKQYKAPQFTPHITLYSGINNARLTRKAVHDCRHITKMKVRVTGIRHSGYIWKTLYFDVGTSKKLAELNRILAKRLGNHAKYRFRPHISLIYKKLPNATRRQIAKEITLKNTLEFAKISIIKSSNVVRNWTPIMKISLK